MTQQTRKRVTWGAVLALVLSWLGYTEFTKFQQSRQEIAKAMQGTLIDKCQSISATTYDVRNLLSACTDPNKQHHGWTPLGAAVFLCGPHGKTLEKVELLLEKGADPNGRAIDEHSETPLMIAVKSC